MGALWWTKTIAFTKTAVVEFDTEQPTDGSVSFTLIDVEASPDDLTKTAELIAQTHGCLWLRIRPDDHIGDRRIRPSGDSARSYTRGSTIVGNRGCRITQFVPRGDQRHEPQPLHLHRRPCAAIISHPSTRHRRGPEFLISASMQERRQNLMAPRNTAMIGAAHHATADCRHPRIRTHPHKNTHPPARVITPGHKPETAQLPYTNL